MDAQVKLGFQAANTELHKLRTLINGDVADNSAAMTTAKDNLINMVNELFVKASTIDGILENTSTTDKGWTASQIITYVQAENQASRDSLIGGAPAEFDTFIELMTAINDNDGDISSAVSAIAANTVLAQQGVDDAAVAQAAADAADVKAVAAQETADTAKTDAATADAKAVAAQTDHDALIIALGPLDTDYAAIVNNGLV